jgi:hypothetical protein
MANDLPLDLLTEIDQRSGDLEGLEELRAAAARNAARLRRPVTAYDVLASARDPTERSRFVAALNRLRAQGSRP